MCLNYEYWVLLDAKVMDAQLGIVLTLTVSNAITISTSKYFGPNVTTNNSQTITKTTFLVYNQRRQTSSCRKASSRSRMIS